MREINRIKGGKRQWYNMPLPLGLLKLAAIRRSLRRRNLHDTSKIPDFSLITKPAKADGSESKWRTSDGSFNDLEHPEMGMAGTRFGRNIPLDEATVDKESLLKPNPRDISANLLARETFQPATILSLLAAAWIQFETHDWFSHGSNQPGNQIDVAGKEQDELLKVDRTLQDVTRTGNADQPPTFINYETHWWDASQIYGSSPQRVSKVRSHVDGKLLIGDDGLLPLEDEKGIDLVGNPGTWWLGIGLLHTLFVKEHNTICDHLKSQNPSWTDNQLFNNARLIVAAMTAKIHTVEWTPAILPNPITKTALHANWWGILGPNIKKIVGRVADSELLSGIVGSSQVKHDGCPFYLTEEFTSVYRMHPLIPDHYKFYSIDTGELTRESDFQQLFDRNTRGFMESMPFEDLLYSFGISHPGAVTLHNYPQFLRQLRKPNGELLDLASVDIIRDRERGVPRYNRFRDLIGRGRVSSFEDLTSNPDWALELRKAYNDDIDQVDLMVGLYAEDLPPGFGFSETAFHIFILMASRRLRSDRFYTKDYRPEVYTQWGLEWIESTTMTSLLLRHYPRLAPALEGVDNAFTPWRKVSTQRD
jgi:hypothetical protein